MKSFFVIVFGGLSAIGIGIGIAYAGAHAWKILASRFIVTNEISVSSMVASAFKPTDGTSISGSRRTIRYTATEEEDLLDAASRSLPAMDRRITAKAYLLKNLTNGQVTVEHNAEQLLPIASLTKLATAVVSRKLIDPDERITIGRKVMATYGNTANFIPGETLTAHDLIYPLLMVSSNDAAEAYAMAYGRSKFVKAMNDWAQSIGAYRTYFSDPSGLSPENMSTADDIALILEWIRTHDPEIMEITALKSKTVRSHTWVNPTHFLSWSYYVGGKNGYTTEANRTGAALFELGPKKNIYAMVVLGSGNRDADVIKLLEKVRE